MDSHDILAQEEALDYDRAFRAELDKITTDHRPRLWHSEIQEVVDARSAKSPSGYLCSGCRGHATYYAPSTFYMVVPRRHAINVRYPWCLYCRDLVLLTAHEALGRTGSPQTYDDFAQQYLCDRAVEDMLAGPLTKRALETFHDDGNRHELVHQVNPDGECKIVGCTRMKVITVCPKHAQEKHQKAVAKAVRANRAAAAVTTAPFLAAIALPLWLTPEYWKLSGILAFLAAGMVFILTSPMREAANQKHRETSNPMDFL